MKMGSSSASIYSIGSELLFRIAVTGFFVFTIGTSIGNAQTSLVAGCGGGNFKCVGPFSPTIPVPKPKIGGGNWIPSNEKNDWLKKAFKNSDGKIGALDDTTYVIKTKNGYQILRSKDSISSSVKLSPTKEQLRQLQDFARPSGVQ